MKPRALSTSLAASVLLLSAAAVAADAVGTRPALTVWDLPVGTHARELPKDAFIDYACGTNGGPPSTPLNDWTEYAKCAAERRTGYREIYFRYDDEAEFVTRAKYDAQVVEQSTSAYNIPIIVSALFDDAGFMVGFRMVSDPRVDDNIRQSGSILASPLMGRYGEDRFACENLPRLPGESEFQSIYIKRGCTQMAVSPGGLDITVEIHQFRKPGQAVTQAQQGPTQGQYESSTRLEAILKGGIADEPALLAALPAPVPTEKDRLIERARRCPGCDLRGVDLKRANLAGANLAGADLSDANLHAANLVGADLTGANLLNANLNRGDLRRAKLAGGLLAGAMLYTSRFDGADLAGANLDGTFAGRAQFAGANLTKASIVDSDLHNARLNDANFTDADLSASVLDDVQMTRSNLSGAKLIQASMWRASLAGANLSRVDARAADLFGANLREADLSAADFSQARLTSANLTAVKTVGTKFSDAKLPPGFVPR